MGISATPPTGRGLVLAPLRGVRFNPRQVSDLAAVTSPPYDVIEPDGVRLLETLDPHNIVRLILPRDDACGPEGRYQHAAETLNAWIRDAVLVPDTTPSLYVYEQVSPTTVQRGLIGALELRQPAERVVLEHENVMPGPVADRLELMRATAANLDPILLVYDGDGASADHIDAAVTGQPLISIHTADRIRHRLWAIQDPGVIAEIGRDLLGRRAMIADGHHRYATYLRLQAEMHNAGHGPGPWDYGLALLVDSRRYPPEIRAIHRVLPKVRADEAIDRLSRWCRVQELGGSPNSDAEPLTDPWIADVPAYLIVAGNGRWLVSHPDPDLMASALPADMPETWRRLDAAVLHHALLDHVLDVPNDPENITYHHDPDDAVRAALHTGGLAVLMRPADPATVVSLAEAGVRMPGKSTSFGPKPRTGIVLRTFRSG